MTFKFLKATFAGAVLSVSSLSANAGLIEADLHSIGDNLITYDSNQNLNWLDLNLTANMSETELLNSSYVKIDGMRLATTSEVKNMFFGHFSGITDPTARYETFTQPLSQGYGQVLEFIRLFGVTYSNVNANFSYGWYINDSDILSMASAYSQFVTPVLQQVLIPGNGWNYESARDTGQQEFGWYLVKNTTEVPEPSTLAIFALGMIALASRRFKKQS
jgi:hypothetical protein